MLAIWSLAPLPFLNPAWTSGSSRFTYCWRLQVEHYFTSNCLHTCNLNFVFVVQLLSHDWMNCSKPDFPILHHLLEFAQTQVHWVNDATQPSHPCPPVLNLSQHQGLFQWVGISHQVARVLKLQLQHQSSQWIFRVDSHKIDWFDLFAAQGTLKSFSSTTVQNHQFLSTQPSLWSNSRIHTWLLEKP